MSQNAKKWIDAIKALDNRGYSFSMPWKRESIYHSWIEMVCTKKLDDGGFANVVLSLETTPGSSGEVEARPETSYGSGMMESGEAADLVRQVTA